MGKARSKIEKGNDHRNWGFDAKDALYEHNRDTSITKRVPITTKEGLHDYTNAEIAERSGDVVSYNANEPMKWATFKTLSDKSKKQYLEGLRKLYPGAVCKDFADMFGVSQASVYNTARALGVSFKQENRLPNKGDRLRFRRDMLGEITEEEQTKEPVEQNAREPFLLLGATFVCDAKNIKDIIKSIGIEGRVKVTVETVGKEVV